MVIDSQMLLDSSSNFTLSLRLRDRLTAERFFLLLRRNFLLRFVTKGNAISKALNSESASTTPVFPIAVFVFAAEGAFLTSECGEFVYDAIELLLALEFDNSV